MTLPSITDWRENPARQQPSRRSRYYLKATASMQLQSSNMAASCGATSESDPKYDSADFVFVSPSSGINVDRLRSIRAILTVGVVHAGRRIARSVTPIRVRHGIRTIPILAQLAEVLTARINLRWVCRPPCCRASESLVAATVVVVVTILPIARY